MEDEELQQGDGGQTQEDEEQTPDKAAIDSSVVSQSEETPLIGRQLRKEDGTCGEVLEFDSESNLYKVSFGEDHSESMSLEDVTRSLLPEISFKRFRQKKKEPTPERTERVDTQSGISEDELSEPSEGEEDEQHPASMDEAGATDVEPTLALTADEVDEVDERETPPPPLENGNAEESDRENREPADGLDSETSLEESDLENITRKPRKKKKRKHVLTMQKYKYKKRKQNKPAPVQGDSLDEAEKEKNQRMVDAMEEAAPRKRSRTRKLTEVDEIQRKRQKITSEFKKRLKKTSKADSASAKSKETDDEQATMVEETPAATQEHTDAKPSPFDRGIKLRGRKLRKVFKGKASRGEITDYCRRTRNYQVRYEDGEVEKLMWKEVKTMLVPFEEMQSWDDPDNDTLLSVYKETTKEKASKVKPASVN